jgi:O-acetyl-ADP-ribose deacetylase (regulator of RNase III)
VQIRAVRGDITTAVVDAIVNAANEGLLGGGGVDGAIHRAAGPELLEACRRVPQRDGVRCPVGEARILPGFRLPVRHVIATVGPIYRSHKDPPEALASAHRESLRLAVEHGLRTVAFPAISCGVYGYPPREAAAVAVGVCGERDWDLDAVRFVLFSEDLLTVWLDAIAAASPSPPKG